MTAEQIIALFGAAAVGLVVRLSNVVIAWLSRALKVDPPAPILPPDDKTTAPPGAR